MPDRQARILVVDDDEAKRYTVSRSLRGAGFEVVEVGTGAEGLRQASAASLIVLDVRLPDMDGYEVCRRLKADPQTTATPVLHLSATFTGIDSRVRGLESGADAYLTDVSEPPVLIATVRALLRLRRAEEAARELASQWQATFDAISDGVCLIGPDGLLTRCNRALEGFLRRPTTELIGQPLSELHANIPAGPESPFARAAASRARESTEIRAGDRWWRLMVDPLPTGGAVAILADITEKRKAVEAQSLLADAGQTLTASLDWRKLLKAVADVVVPRLADWCLVSVTDEDGTHRPLTVAHADLSRPAPDSACAVEIARVIETGQPEVTHGSKMTVPLIARGRTLGAIAFITAESGRRYGVEDLALATELARRTALAVDNIRLYREARDADRHKDDFLAMLAHELRNPLAAADSALRVLALRDDPATVKWAREIAGRQVRHLVRMVDDLLDVSRLQRRKVRVILERIDLTRLVSEVTADQRTLTEQAGLTLEVEIPGESVWVRGDPARLTQILGNLVANAAKFAGDGCRVLVALSASADGVVLRVEDNGVGIEAALLTRLFDPFVQGDASLERTRGGLGLGLALVKGLTELHGGTVEVESDGPGQGARFTIRLPLASPAEAGPPETETVVPEGRPLRVLLVEDQQDAADSLRKLLELMGGHTVEVALTGVAGVEMATAAPPDVVLSDLGLPGMDGYAVARSLRANPATAGLFLVALSGYAGEEDRRRSGEAGFDAHLQKPADPDELQRLLAGYAARQLG